jgi:hypothetical protein
MKERVERFTSLFESCEGELSQITLEAVLKERDG